MKRVFLLFVPLMFSQVVLAEVIKGELFEQKTHFGKKLYDLVIDVQKKEGLTQTFVSYKDLQGNVVVQENGTFKGDELISLDIDQKQTQEKGFIQVEGDQVLFTYEKDGKKKTDKEKLRKPLLSQANFNTYVANHWDEIVRPEGVEVRFAVWFRLETVGFKIFKVGERQKDGQKWVHLRMKPSNMVIAALVDPLELWYEESSRHLMEMSGRVSPKTKSGDSFMDLDCDVRYTFPNSSK
ncbi:hypothetical protein [Bdellovibrio sp. HCB337]|uniref:hypothetical protein n=1 Tax=Bdellovibrio sp. HCB337 TaxID=3394358 RepID=UPI0039A627B6